MRNLTPMSNSDLKRNDPSNDAGIRISSIFSILARVPLPLDYFIKY